MGAMFRASNGAWLVPAAIVFGVAGCSGNGTDVPSGNSSLYNQSIQRLKSLDTSLLMYSQDWDATLPPAGKWVDGLGPYVSGSDVFKSPAAPGGYGYALNSDVAGKALTAFGDTSVQVSLFDSTDLSRNATDPTSTEPNPPRYGAKNTVAYLDGHVQDEDTGDPGQVSLSRVKPLSVGLQLYSGDNDGRLPLANAWMDGLDPYVQAKDNFHSPAVAAIDPTAYGYALNSAVAGHAIAEYPTPATVLGIFDSTDTKRNATDPTTTLPNPPRYSEGNAIGYLDGHAGTRKRK